MVAIPRPAAGPPRPYRFPIIEKGMLDNGTQLIVSRVPKLPLVTLSAVIGAGSALDPENREGAASLTARLLIEGTRRRSATQLTEALEKIGTSISTGADWDSSLATVTSLTDHFGEVAGIFAEVLLEPTFPERELQRLKAERIADLLQIESEPRTLADEAFQSFIYSQKSRFAIQGGGSKESVEAMTAADILGFYRGGYAPRKTALIVAGDVSYAEAEDTLARAFRNWASAGEATSARENAIAYTSRRVRVIDRRGASQSELRVGHGGVPRNHPDYFPIVVMNAILGGLFGSRINLNLREAHGYTYGASSYFDWRKSAGPFVISTAVQTEVTAAALTEILRELDRMRQDPVAAAELSLAKDYLDGVFPIRYETTGAVAAALANMIVFDLPEDYFDSYRQNIQSVSAEQVLDAAQKHLRPELLQTLIVGDVAAIRESVGELGLGVIDAQGQ
jgi:zinc protease